MAPKFEVACQLASNTMGCYDLWEAHCNGEDAENANIIKSMAEQLAQTYNCWAQSWDREGEDRSVMHYQVHYL